jgi:hypothetical protein
LLVVVCEVCVFVGVGVGLAVFTSPGMVDVGEYAVKVMSNSPLSNVAWQFSLFVITKEG